MYVMASRLENDSAGSEALAGGISISPGPADCHGSEIMPHRPTTSQSGRNLRHVAGKVEFTGSNGSPGQPGVKLSGLDAARRSYSFNDKQAAMPDTHTDWNLLFGIVALQMDFISRDALVTAMNSWAVDKQRSLGAILPRAGRAHPEPAGTAGATRSGASQAARQRCRQEPGGSRRMQLAA